MKTVRCKFKCTEVTEQEGPVYHAKFSPVTEGSEENKKFFKWTPGGSLNLSAVNAKFEVGREYYVDLIDCKSLEPQPG